MTKKHLRHADGMYHVNGQKFKLLNGSRAQVAHKTAYKTKYGLTKDKIKMNKHGKIVSVKKSKTAKRDRRLEKAGYFTEKGKFGWVRKDGTRKRKGKKGKKTRGRK